MARPPAGTTGRVGATGGEGGVAVTIGGIEYVKTSEVCERWPDVGPDTVNNWTRPQRGAGGVVEPPLLEPLRDGRGRVVKLDRERVYAWPAVVEAECHAGASGKGRPRTDA